MKNLVRNMFRPAALVSLLACLGVEAAVAAPAGDWPCIQRRVAEMSIGQMWAGPAIENLKRWREDRKVAKVVPVLAARRTSMEEAATMIERFAGEAGAEKNIKLTLLFSGLFDRLNAERGQVIAGIERYARKQRALSERIKETDRTLAARKAGAEPKSGEPSDADLEQMLRWDTRIYEERNKALTYVCETPTILEQRTFGLARQIQNLLD